MRVSDTPRSLHGPGSKLAARARIFAPPLARVALGAGFLSAVADRFGIWGPPGATNVAWGDFESFVQYAAKINPYLPTPVIPALGWIVTGLEIILGVALIAGVLLRPVAFLSGCLLAAFAFGMTVGTGVKTALDASVPAAAAAAFLLAAWPEKLGSKRNGGSSCPEVSVD
jgi:uncharacterized membrane protein YphA (DoxX/SURF4 family)